MANGASVRVAGPADARAICHLLPTFDDECCAIYETLGFNRRSWQMQRSIRL